MKRLATAILVLLAVSLTLLASLPFTAVGTRFLVERVNQIEGIDIRFGEGLLAGQMRLEQVNVETGGIRIELGQIDSLLDSSCLWRSAVCFSQLSAASITVVIPDAGAEESSEEESENSLLQWPVRIEAPELRIGELRVEWPGGGWRQGELHAAVALYDSTVQIDGGEIVEAGLQVEPAAEQPENQTAGLPEIFLPLELVVNGLALQGVEAHIGEVEEVAQVISLAGQWRGNELRLHSLAVSSPRGKLAGAGGLAFVGDWPLSFSAGIDVQALDEFGEHALEASIEGDLSKQVFALEGEIRGLGYEQVQLRANGSHRQGTVQLDAIELRDVASASELLASGRVLYSEEFVINATIKTGGLQLPPLDERLAGRLNGSGELAFQMSAQSWQLEASSLDLEGVVNALPAALSGHVILLQGGRLGNTRLQAAVNGAELKLEGDPAGGALLEVQLDEFARWQEGARGGLQLLATRPAGSSRVELAGQLQQPAFGTIGAEAGQLSGYFTLGLEQFELALDLESPELGPTRLSALHLAASGSLDKHRIALSSRGDVVGTLALDGGKTDDGWRGVLAPAQLDTRYGQWSLAEQVALGLSDGAITMQSHCWRHPQLDICLGDTRFGASGEMQLNATGDIAAFNGLVPPDIKLQGTLDTSLTASWGEKLQLVGTGSSRNVKITRDFGLGDEITIAWDSTTTQLQVDDAGATIALEMQRDGHSVLALDLLLPPERDGDMRGELQLSQMQLRTIAPWAPELSRLEGELNGNIKITGKPDSPDLAGRVSLSDGHLALEGNPTEVRDLELHLTMRGEEADIRGQALLGGGELQLDGRVQLPPELQLVLEISGERHQLLVPPSTEMLVSEDLVLVLVPGLIDVSGEVRVAEGVLRHEQLPAGSVALSPDVIEVDLTGNPIVEEDRWDVRSDIWIRLRDRFRVAGANLNATLGGDLNLRQEPGKPMQLFGSLNILGGELNAYRQQLVIRRGTVAFSGDPANPELDIRAERDLREQGVTVGASLQGNLEEPRLDVFSDPPMSQGEAMSYLIRGRGLDSGAGADGTSLALAMGADVVNQSGILAPVNRLPGISNVSFGSTGTDDDTAATVSGYLGERIYLSYGIGLYEPINVLTARLYLQSRLWIEVVSRLENSVDIYYSFDVE